MILVFGGTTEGRKAAEVLEEAGNRYYYSTRNDGQEMDLVHGVRLTGGMELPEMIAFCREHDIRLIVDAAHPFAENLHRNLLFLSDHIHAPIIRYDRIYPAHDADLYWCKDYQDAICRMEAYGVRRLLALTGVNTIGVLRPFWEKHECWWRILNRESSLLQARKWQFPEDHLVFYGDDNTSEVIAKLRPDAIITKESGLSGGFTEKVEAARQTGTKVFVVQRPLPAVGGFPADTSHSLAGALDTATMVIVNGPYGLRRMVERLMPEFYPLHSGLTTGTCATAAVIAATLRLLKNETPAEVPVLLPNGESIMVAVNYGDGYASVFKEAGDDPDITNGIEIRATVEATTEPSPNQGGNITFLAGEGVGTFTLPGFDYPPGSPAINKAPREMIRKNLEQSFSMVRSTRRGAFQSKNDQWSARPAGALARARMVNGLGGSPTPHSFNLTILLSAPQGAEIARRTFNPRLGIEGGISIIGVSGIVKPFSEEAFIDSIRKCMTVAKASGADRVVINSGGKSERFVKALYPELPRQAFVEYGNYIGETLKMADELGFRNVTLGVMLGKAVKLAAGHLDTHSRKATMDKAFILQILNETGVSLDLNNITLARELWKEIPNEKLRPFAQTIIRHCAEHCRPLLPNGSLTILLIDDEGNIFQ